MKNNYPLYWLTILLLLLTLAAISLAQTRMRSDINQDGTVNLIDQSILANDWLKPDRAWLINRVTDFESLVTDLETLVMIYETRWAIMTEQVDDFNWFLFVGKQRWGIDPNEIRVLYDPNGMK